MNDLSSPEIRAVLANRMMKEYDEASVVIFREGHRNHLGASVIGEPCEAAVWFGWRWIVNTNPGGRMYRLFQRGHREEPFVIQHYRTLGYIVNEVDPASGKQYRLSALHGHFGGSCDGRGYLPARFEYEREVGYEVKTANDKQFKKLIAAKSASKWKPKYARQMDVYGSAWGLEYFVFIVVNKNDDSVYIEIYACQPLEAQLAYNKAERVISSQTRPHRISETPAFQDCRYCDFINHCHKGAMPEVNCRSCKNAIPTFDSRWHCNAYGQTIPDDVIRVGCSGWKSII
jgi:hypothetical protein